MCRNLKEPLEAQGTGFWRLWMISETIFILAKNTHYLRLSSQYVRILLVSWAKLKNDYHSHAWAPRERKIAFSLWYLAPASTSIRCQLFGVIWGQRPSRRMIVSTQKLIAIIFHWRPDQTPIHACTLELASKFPALSSCCRIWFQIRLIYLLLDMYPERVSWTALIL